MNREDDDPNSGVDMLLRNPINANRLHTVNQRVEGHKVQQAKLWRLYFGMCLK